MLAPSSRLLASACLALAALAGCAPAIGDSCESSVDCSGNGDRICDTAQPRGYCTVSGCEPDTCPDGALCVEWRGTPDRTAVRFCMKKCGSDSGCRDGYSCMGTEDPRLLEGYPDDLESEPIAQIVDLREGRTEKSFCVADPDAI